MSLFEVDSETDKLSHRPGQRRGRARAFAEAKLRLRTFHTIPHLLRNHHAVVCKSHHRVEPLTRAGQLTARDLVFTAFAGEQSPETSHAVTAVIIAAIWSLAIGVVIVTIPTGTTGSFHFD